MLTGCTVMFTEVDTVVLSPHPQEWREYSSVREKPKDLLSVHVDDPT